MSLCFSCVHRNTDRVLARLEADGFALDEVLAHSHSPTSGVPRRLRSDGFAVTPAVWMALEAYIVIDLDRSEGVAPSWQAAFRLAQASRRLSRVFDQDLAAVDALRERALEAASRVAERSRAVLDRADLMAGLVCVAAPQSAEVSAMSSAFFRLAARHAGEVAALHQPRVAWPVAPWSAWRFRRWLDRSLASAPRLVLVRTGSGGGFDPLELFPDLGLAAWALGSPVVDGVAAFTVPEAAAAALDPLLMKWPSRRCELISVASGAEHDPQVLEAAALLWRDGGPVFADADACLAAARIL